MEQVIVHLPLTGRCQCGAIKYRVVRDPILIWACHCSGCQAQTGSAFALSMLVPENGVVYEAGEPAEYVYTADSGNVRVGYFCAECGSRIANGQKPTNGVLSMRAGTLDDTLWIEPAGHIWTSSAQPWFEVPDNTPFSEEQPENDLPFWERFHARFRFVGGISETGDGR